MTYDVSIFSKESPQSFCREGLTDKLWGAGYVFLPKE